MWLPWRDMVPLAEFPELKVWTSLTETETALLMSLGRAKRVIEIGTAFGYSTLVLASASEHVWSIDPHAAGVAVGNFDLHEATDVERLKLGTLAILTSNLETTGLADKVTIVQDWSQHYLEQESPDANFAFIDGDHSFGACSVDIGNCERLLDPGDLICVHDYDDDSCPGVRDAVNKHGGIVDVVDSIAVIRV